jgi:ferredoxin-NADP reductase/predicted pyridoxine 5'-phosphate oxidase superfamily flavin-nucleotide-binding protein
MGHKFAEIAFTNAVREVQSELGSRSGYSNMDEGPDYNHQLGYAEANFIAARDSFYMASVSETQWPYIQHRGGPVGFMRILDEKTLGFADFSGNRQYVSTANFKNNDKVALFFMDYVNQTRLKLLGKIRQLRSDEATLLAKLAIGDYRANVERAFVLEVIAFDWNCPKYITPRYSQAQVESLMTSHAAQSSSASPSEINEFGNGPLSLVVSAISQLTPSIRSYRLKPISGQILPEVQAGAHLRVPVVIENTAVSKLTASVRDYSICSNPHQRKYYDIAVQCESRAESVEGSKGQGGSEAVHKQLELGTVLNCANPLNDFRIHSDKRPALLIAAGIGITPIKAMLESFNKSGVKVQLHYAGREVNRMAFVDELLERFDEQVTLYYSAADNRLNLAALLANIHPDTVIYACGPPTLLEELHSTAKHLKIADTRIRTERFSRD